MKRYSTKLFLAIITIGVIVGLTGSPASVKATYNDTTYVADTYYEISDPGQSITSGSTVNYQYHALLLLTPDDGHFINTYIFEDTRVNNNDYKVIIKVCVESTCQTARTVEYSPPYYTEGEKEVSYAFTGTGSEEVYVGTVYTIYEYVNGDWEKIDYSERTEGLTAYVAKI